MYAIVNIAGQQTKVEANKFVYGTLSIGTPELNVAVKGTIVAHVQGDKVLVFKKKRRKGYKKLNGHRQQFTKVLINSIG
jgi:large subunit ribosomal protein L21